MPRYKDEPPAVRVYTVCDESRYLIVRNVPALGCGDELLKLFSSYGPVEECKPMDAEECEPYTDVYWIKFNRIDNARFAKRKLDESVFIGNRLRVSYAPEYETVSDTIEKLEWRRKEVVARLNPRKTKAPSDTNSEHFSVADPLLKDSVPQTSSLSQWELQSQSAVANAHNSSAAVVSTDKEYFPLESMNRTVHLVRDKLHKIQSSGEQKEDSSSKRPRIDNRRRI